MQVLTVMTQLPKQNIKKNVYFKDDREEVQLGFIKIFFFLIIASVQQNTIGMLL